MRRIQTLLLGLIFVMAGCTSSPESTTQSDQGTQETPDSKKEKIASMKLAQDFHSYSRPNEAKVKHLNWEAEVNFETKVISGSATYDIENLTGTNKMVFDIRDLDIHGVSVDGAATEFSIGPNNDELGSPLVVDITPDTKKVSISYSSSPDAGALLWVEGDNPFLFTQSQAILARTWLPCQDSPGVRYTYEATVKVPSDLLAMMSATNPTEKNETGIYNFKMEQPIPSYLMALAVGNVEFREVGAHTGVYATPDLIEKAAYEFAEMEEMLEAAEALYGKYVWERYDLLILPAAFPFGGMENPRLTFATPTIIAGDRSLTSLVAHELAHSWSGNLVTNSTWDDFWLNEGFTVYFEQRIMESVYGRETSEMLAQLSFQGLQEEVEVMMADNPADTHLKLHLKGRNPDDGMTAIAYDKGYFFLRLMEETVGRDKFDVFLNNYFTSNSFQVMDTEQFIDYLRANLLDEASEKAINLEAWIYGPGIPDNAPKVDSDRIEKVDATLASWSNNEITTDDLPFENWKYQERYRFLTNMPESVPTSKLAELDAKFNLTNTGNNEVLFAWLQQAIRKDYEPAFGRVESFLIEVGRRKFLTPLYKDMKETGKLQMAKDIYVKARPNYHSVSYNTMDELLNE